MTKRHDFSINFNLITSAPAINPVNTMQINMCEACDWYAINLAKSRMAKKDVFCHYDFWAIFLKEPFTILTFDLTIFRHSCRLEKVGFFFKSVSF
jgi:hypothetical protein